MFGLSPLVLLIAAGVFAAITGGAYFKGHSDGVDSERTEWVEYEDKLNDKINAANTKANQAAIDYETAKANLQPQIIYVKQKVKDALQTNSQWRDVAIPDSVRDAVTEATAALSAAQSASGVPTASGTESTDERRTNDGVHSGAGFFGRLFTPSQSASGSR